VAKVQSAKYFPIKFITIKLLPFPTGAGDSSILQNVDLCSTDHTFCYLVGVWGCGLKRPALGADHTPPRQEGGGTAKGRKPTPDPPPIRGTNIPTKSKFGTP
jgi:hypothetical protein